MTPLCQTFAIDINAKLDRYYVISSFIHDFCYIVLLFCRNFLGFPIAHIVFRTENCCKRSSRKGIAECQFVMKRRQILLD